MKRALPVRTQLARVIAPLLLMTFLLGLLGIAGVARTNDAVRTVVDEVTPALAANQNFLQAMTDAETGIRGWVINGEDDALGPYHGALARLPQISADLRRHAAGRPGLDVLVDEQEELAAEWFRVYAEPRLAAGPGDETYDAVRFVRGKAAFDALREQNAEITGELRADAADAREEGRVAFRRAVVAVLVLTLLAGAIGWVLARRLRRRLEVPLEDLERTVERLLAGDLSARAQPRGPREVASVAHVLNRLAEANQRAEAVETQTHARLLELDQAKTDFVSNVSHELRTPLTSIRGYLELLREETEDQPPHAQQMWQVVDRNVQRLGLLIEDLLTLANVESRNTTLTEVDLGELVEDVLTDLRVSAANKGVTLTCELPARPSFVLADRTQLLRAVLNVVSNAVKFCRQDGSVQVRLFDNDDELVLTVRDDGIGIPEAELASLGGRFFRASNAVEQHISGTGLGIRMVQVILGRHGGTIAFDSVQDEFTLVTMRLPRRFREPWPAEVEEQT